LFQTADDLLYLSVPYDEIWERFCTAIDREQWLEDSRFRSNEARLDNREELYDLIEDTFADYPRAELVSLLLDAGVPVAELQTVADAARDDHLAARDIVTTGRDVDGSEITVTRTPVHIDGEVPEIRTPAAPAGQDTDDILDDVGFDGTEIAELHRSGTVRSPKQ
jgi:crotonobetainyl-CoA:carnitine CoA-transferase CaiB-like acyl-CoA transferase